ncbi:MAG: arginine repressor [Actinobacteria bacterium]|nr:arginine repressor [Actinomycetota bacterium]MCL6104095.1 arginine repressor [Actinomycetota bacterium]
MKSTKKPQRQHLLKRLIETNSISAQTQLVEAMASKGIQVTQATVARDLAEIGAIKVRGQNGINVYTVDELPQKQTTTVQHLKRVLGEWTIEVKYSANLVVLRTPPGSAHVVASALDRSGIQGVLGTVAGDDTILIVTENNLKRVSVVKYLKELAGL